jgi:outer membrane protein insertion porin family/translocation and assembly module TamA
MPVGRDQISRLARALLVVVLCCTACVRKDYPPNQPVVSEVDIESEHPEALEGVLEGLATTASQRFLGIWDGVVFEYSVYDSELLAKDLERIQRHLESKGYYEARVTAARVVRVDEHRVRVHIRVTLGTPVRVTAFNVLGLEQVPFEVARKAIARSDVRVGDRFDETAYARTKAQVLRVLQDSGYAFAKVDGRVTVDIPSHAAGVELEITPGPEATLGSVTVIGLHEVPEDKVRANLELARGQRYSQAELEDGRRALVRLNVFSSVRVIPELDAARGSEVPITIRVEEAKLRTVTIGTGASLDSLQLSSHATIGWEHRNYLGGLRRLSVDAKPGIVYFPTRFGNLTTPNRLLFQNELSARFRQPSTFEGRTTGFVDTNFNVYPLLYPETAADEAVVGFYELKNSTGLERAFLEHELLLVPSFNTQLELPLDYSTLTIGRTVPAEDERLLDLLITFPELVANLDLRDDPLNPHSGAFFSASVQTATPIFGGDVSDTRLRPEARFYVPISKRVTFATRFVVGLLFPRDYGDTFADPASASSTDPATQVAVSRDQQKVLFRGFFSGGANSNRGYPFRGVGPHGPVPFLSGRDCAPGSTLRECNRPLGGLSLWESSFEVRFLIFGPVGAVTFLDSSNVSRSQTLDFSGPHLSAGAGLRYHTPIGNVRFDTGYRIPGAQELNRTTPASEPQKVFGLPMALHLSLGEAF